MKIANFISQHGADWRLPGIANLHSHAFQRAMAGLAERQGHPQDSFWTWRETMYSMASRFDPDTLRAVAAQLYVEMLEAGYTQVCEFHYVHHQPDGRPYPRATAMCEALIDAARMTGIRLTLLPVLYMTGGFDARPLSERQRRFGHDVDAYLRLFGELRQKADPLLRVGCALHSLRAVPAAALQDVLAGLPADCPIHIHIAEQQIEVEECQALRGAPPVRWLLDHVPVDGRWTLVHATHLRNDEIRDAASSGATVAICPTTEANLGDGVFALREWLDAGGRWGIGSDSHVSVSPVEELRWLEYVQRLVTQRRNIASDAHCPSVGETLLTGVRQSAAAATGFAEKDFADDWLVLDGSAPVLSSARANEVADRWIFAGNRPLIKEVHVAGTVLVQAGCHREQARIADDYRRAVGRLRAD